MTDRSDEVVLHPDGRLEPTTGLRNALSEAAGRYRWLLRHPGLMVLRRSAGEGLDLVEPRVLMAGEILSKMTILEVINMIASTGWSGELYVYEGSHQRRLSLAQGVLKSAWSNVPSEHLGELLVARQALTPDQLAECVLELAPTTRFGEIVVRKGYIGREQLFEHLRAQMEQIFFGSLLTREGSYAFMSDDAEAEPAPASFHIPLQALLMEGVQRIDEMARFRERVPHGLLCPVVNLAKPHPAPSADDSLLLELMTGDRNILDIARELGWDEYHATKGIHALMEGGYVTLKPARHLDAVAVERLVERFNAVLRDIHDAVARHGGVDETRTNLNAWIQGSGYGGFFGEDVDPAQGIEVPPLIVALEQADLEKPLEALYQALHELTSFAMFAATPLLPRDTEHELAREVDRRLRAIPSPTPQPSHGARP